MIKIFITITQLSRGGDIFSSRICSHAKKRYYITEAFSELTTIW